MNLKPMRDINLFPQIHMRLDPDLYELVEEKDGEDDEGSALHCGLEGRRCGFFIED
jgi:hypothetical protein